MNKGYLKDEIHNCILYAVFIITSIAEDAAIMIFHLYILNIVDVMHKAFYE